MYSYLLLFFSKQVWFQNRRAKQRREEQQCIAVPTSAKGKPMMKSPIDPSQRLHTVEYLPWSCQSSMYHQRPTVQYSSALNSIVPRWTNFYPYPSSLFAGYYKPATSTSLMTSSSLESYRWPLELIQQHRAMIKQM